MDAQSDNCEPPLYNPQPPGKIRKALKLFSKRKPGSGVARIFSLNVKGEGELKSPPSSSKPIDGLTEAEAESVDLDPEDSHKDFASLDEPTSIKKHHLESSSTRQSLCSLTSAKSLSFLGMLRWNRKGGGGKTESQTESQRSGQQRKGFRNLLGSVRWPRKDTEDGDEASTGPPLLASRSNSVEIIKENLSATSKPEHHFADKSEISQLPPSHNDHLSHEDTKVSGAAKPSTNDRLSMLFGDISSILSLDTLASGGDIVADVEAEWVKVSSHAEVKTITPEDVEKEVLLGPKLTSSITKPSTPAKSMPSPTTKQTLSPPSTPSPNTLAKRTPSYVSSPTPTDLTIEPLPSPEQSQDSFLIPSSNIIPHHINIPKSSPTSTTLTTLTKPPLTPTSPPTPEPSPEPSPTIFPSNYLDHVSKSCIPVAEKDSEPDSARDITPEPTYAPSQATTPNAALAPITKATQSTSYDTRHSIAPVIKYPPFITSTKPIQTAPVIRPKIVTTFGLSTSRNTAPIIKPESKPPAHQNRSGQSQTEKNGSVTQKSPLSEGGPPHVDRHLFVVTDQPTSATLSGTFKNPPHTSLPTQLPSLSNKPAPNIAFHLAKTEKEQRDVASARAAENTQPASSFKSEKKTIMKPTTLSRIPVSGGGKLKPHHKDVQLNTEERLLNLPTPGHEEEAQVSSPKEISSKDALINLFTGAVSPAMSSDEDVLDSEVSPTMEKNTVHKESKIPIKHGSTATSYSSQGKTEVRSKIPVSKVPVRRINNTGSSSTAAATRK